MITSPTARCPLRLQRKLELVKIGPLLGCVAAIAAADDLRFRQAGIDLRRVAVMELIMTMSP
jgi:hypothetical protein